MLECARLVPDMEGEKVDCVQRQGMTPLQSSSGGCEVPVDWLIEHGSHLDRNWGSVTGDQPSCTVWGRYWRLLTWHWYQGRLFTLALAIMIAVAAAVAVKFLLLYKSETYLIITLWVFMLVKWFCTFSNATISEQQNMCSDRCLRSRIIFVFSEKKIWGLRRGGTTSLWGWLTTSEPSPGKRSWRHQLYETCMECCEKSSLLSIQIHNVLIVVLI